MLLTSAHVTNYKSIEDADDVPIDSETTVLVGQNESGKTVFLEALHKANSVEGAKYDYIDDYPRKWLSRYEPKHKSEPAVVVRLTYTLTTDEIDNIHKDLGFYGVLGKEHTFTVTHRIDGSRTIGLTVNTKTFVDELINSSPLSKETKDVCLSSKDIRELISVLSEEDLNEEGVSFLESIKVRFLTANSENWNLLNLYIWRKHISARTPKFLYFDEYKVLPGKINLNQLKAHKDSNSLNDEERTILGLLHLARIDLEKLIADRGYEQAKARLEGISNAISDKIFEFWTQNQELEVQFDIQPDPMDDPPYNSGKNLYVRIRSQRHRVSVPLDKRSKGFIWFFSFLVWFDSIQEQVNSNTELILLLDEPGLSLHALAQEDLLSYIDDLSTEHQIIYTTHSPFMVRTEKLHSVRTVEDKRKGGTKVSTHVSKSDEKTLFPLQAALGYSIAQNLFIGKYNLLVEGPSDLVYLGFFSDYLKSLNRIGLADEVTIVPVGGLDKLSTFVALLGANQLDIVVLHDWDSSPEKKLEDLIRHKIIRERQVLHYGQFRGGSKAAKNAVVPPTDIEDYFNDALYISLFEKAFENELSDHSITASDLPKGDRLILRINQFLKTKGITLRRSGGFNHYRVASYFAGHPPTSSKILDTVLDRFEALFAEINRILGV